MPVDNSGETPGTCMRCGKKKVSTYGGYCIDCDHATADNCGACGLPEEHDDEGSCIEALLETIKQLRGAEQRTNEARCEACNGQLTDNATRFCSRTCALRTNEVPVHVDCTNAFAEMQYHEASLRELPSLTYVTGDGVPSTSRITSKRQSSFKVGDYVRSSIEPWEPGVVRSIDADGVLSVRTLEGWSKGRSFIPLFEGEGGTGTREDPRLTLMQKVVDAATAFVDASDGGLLKLGELYRPMKDAVNLVRGEPCLKCEACDRGKFKNCSARVPVVRATEGKR